MQKAGLFRLDYISEEKKMEKVVKKQKDAKLISVNMEMSAYNAVSEMLEIFKEKYGFKLSRTAVIERAVLEMRERMN